MSQTPEQVYNSIVHERSSDMSAYMPYLRSIAKGRILEIGVRGGASTSAFLLGLQEHGGHLYSIDIADCSQLFTGHPQWTFIHSDSREVAKIIGQWFTPTLEAVPLDVLMIDGNHTREGYLSDLKNYSCFVRDGGLILTHDIDTRHGSSCERLNNPEFPSIYIEREYFIFAIERGLEHEELPGGWAGMGVLHWKNPA